MVHKMSFIPIPEARIRNHREQEQRGPDGGACGHKTSPETTKQQRAKKECIIRESNPGHIDGNDVFYH